MLTYDRIIVLSAFLILAGCASKFPPISHTHVGHALSGWVITPNKQGLFVVAEDYAFKIAESSGRLVGYVNNENTSQVGNVANEIITFIGSEELAENEEEYLFVNAFIEATSHLEYAMQSDDASKNFKEGISRYIQLSDIILVRARLIKSLSEAIIDSNSKSKEIAKEINKLAIQNLKGEDVNGNGNIGDEANEYGLRQLRADLADMLAKEQNPIYTPVQQKYLFGLVKLPDGTWAFKSSLDGKYGRY